MPLARVLRFACLTAQWPRLAAARLVARSCLQDCAHALRARERIEAGTCSGASLSVCCVTSKMLVGMSILLDGRGGVACARWRGMTGASVAALWSALEARFTLFCLLLHATRCACFVAFIRGSEFAVLYALCLVRGLR